MYIVIQNNFRSAQKTTNDLTLFTQKFVLQKVKSTVNWVILTLSDYDATLDSVC